MTEPQSAVPILVVLAPLLTALVLPVVGWRYRSAVFPLTLAALAFSCAAAVEGARRVVAEGPLHYHLGGWPPPWGIEFRVDALGALMQLMITVVTLLVGIYSKRSVLREVPAKEVPFYSVYLLLVAGLIGLVSTADMFNAYVFLEITSLTSYALVSIPPTGGFFSKLYLMLGAIEAGNWVFVGVIVLSSLLALAYLANVLRYLYFPRDEDGTEHEAAATPIPPRRHTAPWTMLGPMIAVTAVILLLGLFNGEVVDRFISCSAPPSRSTPSATSSIASRCCTRPRTRAHGPPTTAGSSRCFRSSRSASWARS